MPISLHAPGRFGVDAILYLGAGAVVLVGILLRGCARRADAAPGDAGDPDDFDDAGIPLRLAAMNEERARTAR